MPDRIEAGREPYEGMFVHYHREGVNDWVLFIEKITDNQVIWCWKEGIKTMEEASRITSWSGERYGISDWEDFMINANNRWGRTTITILTHLNKQAEWEV